MRVRPSRIAFASLLVVTTLTSKPADASCIPGFDYAMFAADSLQIQGDADFDSWDSSVGNYATTSTCADSDIGTNSTTTGIVQLQGASTDVCGDAFVGAGGDAGLVIDEGTATIHGTQQAQTTNLALPSVSLPSPALPNAATMSPSFSNTAGVLAPGFTYDDVSCSNGSLTLSAGTYVVKTISLNANCQLTVASGPIEVYFTSAIQLQGGAIANSTGTPGNLMFFGTPTATQVQVQGGAGAFFAVYAPAADCQVQGNAEVFGAMVCFKGQVQGNAQIHFDKSLANIGGGGFTCTSFEVSRASPVVALIDGDATTDPSVVQGTYETPITLKPTFNSVAGLTGWTFPFIKGHMRARLAASIATTSFSDGTLRFDAATGIPSAGSCTAPDLSCRYVFTNTNTPSGFTYLSDLQVRQLNDANASTIGGIMTTGLLGFTNTEWTTLVQKVLAAPLGGVDRSTVAVIEPSKAIAGARPTIAYFGATDGMLHAVCASTGVAPCLAPSTLGKELWAFMPRVQLPLVPNNNTRIDGSVRVLDVFGTFPTAVTGSPVTAATAAVAGKKGFKTILLFHTGYGVGAKNAAYALDVTEPGKPVLLWEYATPSSPGVVDFGTGVAVAAGPTTISGTIKNLAVFQTNNGGSTSATSSAVVATAIDLEAQSDATAKIWQFTHTYPVPPRLVVTDTATMPLRGVPGGAVPIDIQNTGQGLITNYVFGDLYGSVWRVDAATGSPPTTGSGFTCTLAGSALSGCVPIFSFTTNKRPLGTLPAVFARVSGGPQFVAFASGGYLDPIAMTFTTTGQRLFAVKVEPSTLPETEATAASTTGNLLVNAPFTNTSDRGFAAALVVGTKLLVTTDSEDINLSSYGKNGTASGNIYSADILAGATTTLVTPSATFRGAGSLANAAGTNTAYTGTSETKTTSTTGGISVDQSATAKLTRRIWIRGA